MTGEAFGAAIAAGIVAIFYSIIVSLFDKVKVSSSDFKHMEVPETFKEELNINNKESFIKRIDYWIENGNFEEALKLCTLYNQYNKDDIDIVKRIKYIIKKIN